MRGGWLDKRRVHGRHGLAAFLAVLVALRRAVHGIAALHRRIGRRHGQAVERVRSEGNRHHRQQNGFGKVHL